MQSRVYIGNFSAEGNVFVGNFHGFQFAHTLLTCLDAKPYRPPCCHQHSGTPLQKPLQNFPAMHCVGVSVEVSPQPVNQSLAVTPDHVVQSFNEPSGSMRDMSSSTGCYKTCPTAHIDLSTPSGHLAKTASTCDYYLLLSPISSSPSSSSLLQSLLFLLLLLLMTLDFLADGAAGFQHERRVRLYDVNNNWRLGKDVEARNLRWTITDTCISPDQKFLLYSSISPIVHLVSSTDCLTFVQNLLLSHDDSCRLFDTPTIILPVVTGEHTSALAWSTPLALQQSRHTRTC